MKETEHPLLFVIYSLYLYFLGLSLRNTSKALVIFRDENQREICVCIVGTGYRDLVHFYVYKRKRISAFIIDETVIQIGSQHFWLWICIEPVSSSVLGIYISEARNMLVAEKFIDLFIEEYGKHTNLYRWWYMVSGSM